MTKPKASYTFAAKSRKAMLDYLAARSHYFDHYTAYPFNWNVKAYRVDWQHPKGEHECDTAFDRQWQAYMDSNNWLCASVFEDASRIIAENDWTSYPGDDQGDWHFEFAGRQGGHLVLTKWRGISLAGVDIRETFETMEFTELRAFYRGIVCADSDFTSDKASAEVEYHCNFRRGEWESDLKAKREARLNCEARKLMDSRPDLYGMGA
jgi:hypothetical protein